MMSDDGGAAGPEAVAGHGLGGEDAEDASPMTTAATPTIRLFASACAEPAFGSISPYQCEVKPLSGKAT